MLVTDLKVNEVIHVRTEQEAIAICQLMDNAGLKWCNGKSYIGKTEWNESRGGFCYNPNEGQHSSFGFYSKNSKFKIYRASLFLELEYEIY